MVAVAISVTVVPAVVWNHPTLYAALPVLLWAALRGGTRAVSVAAVGMTFAMDWVTITGRVSALIASDRPAEQVVLVQVFLGVTIISALVVAVEVATRAQAEARARSADAAREVAVRAAAAAAEAERRRISREIHDIVGHALNVVLLQAGAARRVVASDPSLTTELLESIEDVGRDAFRNLDLALCLTDQEDPKAPTNGLQEVSSLVATMVQAGIAVRLEMEADEGTSISMRTQRAVYRLVQESLTNVAKHAPRSQVVVSIWFDSGDVCLSIVDDGHGRQPPSGMGRGLEGMHERAEMLGGHVEFGMGSNGGFSVSGRLPGAATPRA
jgi:signal transduction histidine kinase